MYGTLIRNTGWTFQQCGEQPAVSCFDLLEHLADYPPDYIVLARHYGTGVPPKKQASSVEADPSTSDRQAAAGILGPSRPLPAELRSLVDWAENIGAKPM